MIRKAVCALLVLLMATPLTASANTQSPDELIRVATQQLLGELEANREVLQEDKSKLYAMVDRIVTPLVDFELVSRLILGRHWRGATEAQREAFIREFQGFLMRTYATALFEYTGQPINYRQSAPPSDNKALVKTEIELDAATKVPVNYSMRLNNAGEWKIYEINVDGISLITNYRTTYGRIIEQQGLDGLIQTLTEKNAA